MAARPRGPRGDGRPGAGSRSLPCLRQTSGRCSGLGHTQATPSLEDAPMSHIRRFDHVGITVADLDTVTAFFVGLGLEVEGRTFVEGEFLDTVIGIPDSRTEIVMLRPPDGGTRLELSSFVRPEHEPGSPGLVGGMGEYEHIWRMAYVRGPEGIIVSLAERIG